MQRRGFINILAIVWHALPLFGLLMDGDWYQYPYILGSYIVGAVVFLWVHKKYLNSEIEKNEK